MHNRDLLIGFLPIARTTFDMALAAQVVGEARAQLQGNDLHLVGPEAPMTDMDGVQAALGLLQAQPPDLLIVFQATFADSTMVMAVAQGVDAPLLLWAVPEARSGGRLRLNALCGINLAAHALKRAGQRYHYIYAEPNELDALEKVEALARAGRVRRMLKGARIGRIGEHPDGFDTCRVDTDALRERFGVEVVQMALHPLFGRMQAADRAAVQAVRQGLSQRVTGLEALDVQAVDGTLSAYVTLRGLAVEENLQGFAVRCWPEFFTEAGCAACGAMSMLSDELTPCSCEADVNGTLTGLMLQWLSGEPAFLTDLVAVDREADGLVLWHCGLAPLSMADPASEPGGTVHSNRKLPLLMEFALKPGVVTVARLSEVTGSYRLVIGCAEMLSAGLSFSGTSGVLRFSRPGARVLDTIMTEGLEHHFSLTYGDHTAALAALAQMLGLPVLYL
jgi:L-fucose isomerase-like protein